MLIWLAETIKPLFSGNEQMVFEQIMTLQGTTKRKVDSRETLFLETSIGTIYIKRFHKAEYGEAIADLVRLKEPILGAMNEVKNIQLLEQLGIRTTPLLGYGSERRGLKIRSFMITAAVPPSFALDQMFPGGTLDSLDFSLKLRIIREVGEMVRSMHQAGINHRDLYLNHFRIPRKVVENGSANDQVPLYLMDLHRAMRSKKVSFRWLVKDLGALYFSTMDTYLTQTDRYRFLQVYFGKSDLRTILEENSTLLLSARKRAERMYLRQKRKLDSAVS